MLASCLEFFLAPGVYEEEGLTVFDGAAVLRNHFDYFAAHFRRHIVHQLHRFDDANGLTFVDMVAHVDKRR